MTNLHAPPENARRSLAVIRRSVEELDRLADNLADVGASPARVQALRQLGGELAVVGAGLGRPMLAHGFPAAEHLALAYQGAALLRRRAASPGARRLKRVDLSPAYADFLGSLLESFAAAQERVHA